MILLELALAFIAGALGAVVATIVLMRDSAPPALPALQRYTAAPPQHINARCMPDKLPVDRFGRPIRLSEKDHLGEAICTCRLRRFLDAYKLTAYRIERKLGIPAKTVRAWRAGLSVPTDEEKSRVVELAQKLHPGKLPVSVADVWPDDNTVNLPPCLLDSDSDDERVDA